MIATVVGRDAELDHLWHALTAQRRLLLEGPAGIGKTELLHALLARATADGMLVLRCAPTEIEAGLPLVALADLLVPLADEATTLPDPQRRAVQAALLLDVGDTAVDERALASATRTLLDAAADRHSAGVLVAIDDAPWLDPPSERALRFALRRTSGQVRVVMSRRTTGAEDDRLPLGLESGADVERVPVAPLGVGPLHHVLRQRFGLSLSRPLVVRLAHESGGNPLLAIELTRSMLRLPQLPGPTDDLPVTASMQDLVGASLAALPDDAARAVRVIALMSSPRMTDLDASGITTPTVEIIEEAGLVVVDGDRVRFVHPVHAAAVRASIPAGVRRRMHAELADASTDPDERARHLARSASAPDAEAARELGVAAARAHARGAPELAADLYQRASGLAADDADALSLRLSAVKCLYDCGNWPLAAAGADALASTLTGERLADVLLLRAAIAFSADDLPLAATIASRALTAAPESSALAGRVHAHVAVFVDAPALARRHAEAALELLGRPETVATAETAWRRPPGQRSGLAGIGADVAVLQRDSYRAAGPDRVARSGPGTRGGSTDLAGRHHPVDLVEGHRRAGSGAHPTAEHARGGGGGRRRAVPARAHPAPSRDRDARRQLRDREDVGRPLARSRRAARQRPVRRALARGHPRCVLR